MLTKSPKTTMRLEPDAVDALRQAENIAEKKYQFRPNHSEAMRLASAAWIRELLIMQHQP
jgi:hypothetical protein